MRTVRIAIAEDDLIVRKTIVDNIRQVEKMDLIVEADNGKTLLEFLQTNIVDVIILDIEMPLMDGHDTLIALRNLYPDIKVVMFSAMSNEIIVQKFEDLGASHFICKNAGFEKLIGAIRQLSF